MTIFATLTVSLGLVIFAAGMVLVVLWATERSEAAVLAEVEAQLATDLAERLQAITEQQAADLEVAIAELAAVRAERDAHLNSLTLALGAEVSA